MKNKILRLKLFFVSLLAVAQAIQWDPKTKTLTVTRAECDQLFVEAVPAAGVNYTPGVDVDGNPVISANVAGSPQIPIPKEVAIPIQIDDLSQYFGVNQPFLKEAYMGEVRVNLDNNQVTINGHPLTPPLLEKVKSACGGGE